MSSSKAKVFRLFLGGMEGLGSSGRMIGSISTYPGTYKCPWSVAMAKNPGGGFFTVYRTSRIQKLMKTTPISLFFIALYSLIKGRRVRDPPVNCPVAWRPSTVESPVKRSMMIIEGPLEGLIRK